jgi:D-tyrosyl-tRNA(Tyr) deacylase
MRAVVQRVLRASVTVDGQVVGEIDAGLLVYAAAAPDDADEDVGYLTDKIANLRIFTDDADKMNRSALDVGGQVLVVSAFTVHADARKGRRPSFDSSASGDVAEPLVDSLVAGLRTRGLHVETGRFAAYMRVQSVNDGPICILLDSRRQF